MTKYSKLNFVYKLQKWMDSVPGQTFLNYAYSWGASIVILGTLFKLTHLPGANFFLFLGMGTEVIVFFLSAFDRPFDKTTDGMDLDIHPVMEGESDTIVNGEPVIRGAVAGGIVTGGSIAGGSVAAGGPVGGGGGTVIINGGGTAGRVVSGSSDSSDSSNSSISSESRVSSSSSPSSESSIPANPLGATVIAEATGSYIDELNELTEVLKKVSEQSKRLTADSEEMENLNRTLTGISRVYEMQLKSASSQMGTIDEINEQTRHMAKQIAELNAIYARMIEAMSVQNINRQ